LDDRLAEESEKRHLSKSALIRMLLGALLDNNRDVNLQ